LAVQPDMAALHIKKKKKKEKEKKKKRVIAKKKFEKSKAASRKVGEGGGGISLLRQGKRTHLCSVNKSWKERENMGHDGGEGRKKNKN